MISSLKKRLEALEQFDIDDSWLIIDCWEIPSDEQLQQMETAFNNGQMALLFSEKDAWCWSWGLPQPIVY